MGLSESNFILIEAGADVCEESYTVPVGWQAKMRKVMVGGRAFGVLWVKRRTEQNFPSSFCLTVSRSRLVEK